MVAVGTVADDPAPISMSSRTVASAIGDPASTRAGTNDPTVSSSRSAPASASCSSAVAVKVFECDAIRNRSVVVRRRPASTSAHPQASEKSTSSSKPIATCTPGSRSCHTL